MNLKPLIIFVALLSCYVTNAQTTLINKPDNTTVVPASTQTAVSTLPGMEPQPYNSNNYNYILTWEPQVICTTDAQITSKGRTVEEMHRTIQYFDGLGRPLQTVAWQQSPNKKDLVSMNLYDAFGREQYQFLPFESNQYNVNNDVVGDGYIKSNPYKQLPAFYNTQINGETFFYGHTVYEPSPLNRVVKTFAPGNSWAGSEGTASEKAVKIDYLENTATEGVRIWSITNDPLTYDASKNINSTINIPTSSAAYGDGQLYKTVTSDESGKQSVEYKDKEGQVILKKIQIDNAPSNQHTGWLCTYYIYDDFGLLRFVIPPNSVASSADWNDKGKQDELCFHYEYDARHRMIAKKVPGAAWVYMVYDNRDRLVYSQDGNMRKTNQWMTYFYDALNRQIMTGLMTSASSTHQTLITYATTATTAYYQPSTVNNITVPNTPIISNGPFTYLVTTYYDNYSFTTTTFDNTVKNKLQKIDANVSTDGFPDNPSTNTINMVTGVQVRVVSAPSELATGALLTSVNYYDYKGRLVQTTADNLKGGDDEASTLYDFSNKVISTYTDHINPAAATNQHWGIGADMLYDHMGRVLKTRKRVYYNGAILQSTKLAENTYDPLGRLYTKQLGQKKDVNGYYTTSAPLDSLKYEYNLRGWLTSINKKYATYTNTSSANWFGMLISYDWGFQTNQYNGNISGINWRSKGDGEKRAYGFGYDNANRLLFADFNQYTNSNWDRSSKMDFSVQVGDGSNYTTAYDNNGNIKAMKQMGMGIITSGIAGVPIDDLTYTYFSGSNKLQAVSDATTNFNLGDFTNKNSGTDDYGYDVNGNLTIDKNKMLNGTAGLNVDQSVAGAGSIVYNYLNLPSSLNVAKDAGGHKGDVKYIYDATGNKLEKIVLDYSGTTSKSYITVTDYIGAFVYETKDSAAISSTPVLTAGAKAKVQFISTEEGRMRLQFANSGDINPSGMNFDYFIKDHLGNVRVVLTDEQKQDIYPVADLEGSAAALTNEKAIYDIVDGNIVLESAVPQFLNKQSANPAVYDYPNNNTAASGPSNTNPDASPNAASTKMYKLAGGASGSRTGLGVTLKVMSGDVIDIYGKSYYYLPSGTPPDNSYPVNMLNNILNALALSSPVASTHNGLTGSMLNSNTTGTSGPLNTWLTAGHATTSMPQAYINWVAFDEQFNALTTTTGQAGADAVSATGALKSHHRTITIKENGYLYIYCSNESAIDVFFDNLQIVDTHSPLIEETHYYPFGLTMAGISSQALNFGTPENKFGYNGKEQQSREFSDGSSLEFYDFGARLYDEQIGRWNVIDPSAEKFLSASPYSFSVNNPVLLNDPTGKDWSVTTSEDNGTTHFHITFTGAVIDRTKNQNGRSADLTQAIKKQFEALFNEDNSKDANGGFTVDATAEIREVKSMDDVHDNESIFKIEDADNPDLENFDDNGNLQSAAGRALNGKEIAVNVDFVGDIISGKNNKTLPHEIGHTGGLKHPEDNQGLWGRFFAVPDQNLDRNGRNFMFAGGHSGDPLNATPTGPTKAQLIRIFNLYNSHKLNTGKIDPVNAF